MCATTSAASADLGVNTSPSRSGQCHWASGGLLASRPPGPLPGATPAVRSGAGLPPPLASGSSREAPPCCNIDSCLSGPNEIPGGLGLSLASCSVWGGGRGRANPRALAVIRRASPPRALSRPQNNLYIAYRVAVSEPVGCQPPRWESLRPLLFWGRCGGPLSRGKGALSWTLSFSSRTVGPRC